MQNNLRIAVNAQILPLSGYGGIETVVRVLAALSELDGEEEYTFISRPDAGDWLRPLIDKRHRVVRGPESVARPLNFKGRVAAKLKPLHPLLQRLRNRPKPRRALPVSDGFYESLGCDVIHFPYQEYVICKMPSIFNPHDLQHLHMPQFFSPEERERRTEVYSQACDEAHTVVVASEFVKRDVIEAFGLDAGKVQVIPWAPPTLAAATNADLTDLTQKYQCPPGEYILYPAMTWEHKNHLRLIDAIAALRDEGLRVNLICTGKQNEFYGTIDAKITASSLHDQIQFTGMVEYHELESFYRGAQLVVLPTLFEAASGPLFEAWQHNVPVACSSVTSLPEQAGDAALLFDPTNVREIANAIRAMLSNDKVRQDLVECGRRRLKDFNLVRTAKSYRAVYRKAAGRNLNEEDRSLLENYAV